MATQTITTVLNGRKYEVTATLPAGGSPELLRPQIDKMIRDAGRAGVPGNFTLMREGVQPPNGEQVIPVPRENWDRMVQAAVPERFPNAWAGTEPDEQIAEEGAPGDAVADFRFVDEEHPLDNVSEEQREPSRSVPDSLSDVGRAFDGARGRPDPDEPMESWYPAATEEVARLRLRRRKGSQKESMVGARLGMIPRQNYEMNLRFSVEGQSYDFRSREVFAKNSRLCHQGVTSSQLRVADRVPLLRKVEDIHGESDFYAGRVDGHEMASEAARFMFLGEHERWARGETFKGLIEDGTNAQGERQFKFTFAVQSVLNMDSFSTKEQEMFDLEVKAYRAWAAAPLSVKIRRDNGTFETVWVKMLPLPVAATPFNWACTLEKMLPACFSGKAAARAATLETNRSLRDKLAEAQGGDQTRHPDIKDTLDLLDSGTLTAAEEILARAFVCDRLSIPMIVHCKSSTDRTSMAGAIITAMRQWMKTHDGYPMANGKFVVHRMMEDPDFKELCMFNLFKAQKVAEFSRGTKGFKWGVGKTVLGFSLDGPMLSEIVPGRYLQATSPAKISPLKHVGLGLLGLALGIPLLLVAGILLFFLGQWKKSRLCFLGAIVLLPAIYHLNEFAAYRRLNPQDPLIAKRNLLFPKA